MEEQKVADSVFDGRLSFFGGAEKMKERCC